MGEGCKRAGGRAGTRPHITPSFENEVDEVDEKGLPGRRVSVFSSTFAKPPEVDEVDESGRTPVSVV